jgi:hypothetical protein
MCAKTVFLPGGSGFMVDICVTITNEVYFKIPAKSKQLFLENGISCTMCSNEESKPICETNQLKFTLGKFSSIEDLDSEREKFIVNLKYILLTKMATYEPIKSTIRDLSKLEISIIIEASSARASIICPFDYQICLPKYKDPKVQRVLELFEMASKVNNTILELLLYIISIETLATGQQKTSDSVARIDEIIRFVKEQTWSEDTDKAATISSIGYLKKKGSKKAILTLISRYDIEDGKRIFEDGWQVRNKFAHEGISGTFDTNLTYQLRKLAFDILKRYSEE